MHYTIWIVSPYSHSACFAECADALQSAFMELGHGCEIVTTPPMQRDNVIIMGAHLLHPADMLYLRDPVVWQLEQMPSPGDVRAAQPWTATYLEILKRARVWDYSRVNIETLAGYGIEASLLEVGYASCLTRIENAPDPEGVLFIGSMNQRRAHVLQGLQAHGVKVVHAFDCYGVRRDALVARAKLVVNVHFYESKVWEIVRCSYLLSNRKAVVSETGFDKQLEEPFYAGVAFADYDDLVTRCLNLLDDNAARGELEKRGFEVMAGRRQVDFLREVLS